MKSLAVITLLALGAAQQTPVRDAPVTPTVGTASISGTVNNDATPAQPVRRAIVTLSGGGLVPSRSAVTDDEGRFTITRLPAGRFTVTVSRSGFITSSYGAKRPGRPGTAVTVADGAAVTDLTVKLWRGSAVAGVVRDEAGRPVADVPVFAMPARRLTGAALTLTNDGAVTDDQGRFRLFGLEPGVYAIVARPGGTSGGPMLARTDAEVDAVFARLRAGVGNPAQPASAAPSSMPTTYAPTYYPGTSEITSAEPITLTAGQSIEGLDFPLMRVPASSIEGLVMRPDGTPAGTAEVQLTLETTHTRFPFDEPVLFSARTDAQGRFRLASVTPGTYRVVARAQATAPPREDTGGVIISRPGGDGPSLWARTDIIVAGSDLTGLTLSTAPGRTLRGRVQFVGSTKPPTNLQQIRIFLMPNDGVDRQGVVRAISFVGGMTAREDGSFEIPGVPPGPLRFQMFGPALTGGPWVARSASIGGIDLFDGPVDMAALPEGEIVVTYADDAAELSGTLTTVEGTPFSDVFVIAFSTNPGHWMRDSRRILAVRPDVDGRYLMPRLPAGEYFLSAVSDVDQDEWQDPGFLKELVSASLKVVLGESEKKVQDLRLQRDPR